MLHGDGAIVSVPPGTPGAVPEHLTELGLGWLEGFRELEPEDGWLYVSWQVAGAPDAVIAVPEGFRCWAGEGPGNPTGLALGTVVISGYGQSAAFAARMTLS